MVPIVTGVVRRSSGVIVVIKEINLTGAHDKWLTLMNYIRHSTPCTWVLTFPDSDTAKKSVDKIRTTMSRNPTWFDVEVIRKYDVIYIIKKDSLQKAVIKGA